MSEETKVSGETPETKLPQPKFSEPSASSTSAPASSNTQPFTEAQLAQLEGIIEKRVQSVKDKRFSDLERSNSELSRVVADLKGRGVALPPDLETQYQVETLVKQELSRQQPVDKSMSSQEKAFDYMGVLKDYGLDTNDPEVLKLVGGTYTNEAHFTREAGLLAVRKAKASTPSSSTEPPVSSTVVPTPVALTDAEKSTLDLKLRGYYKQPIRFAKEIKELEKKLGYE